MYIHIYIYIYIYFLYIFRYVYTHHGKHRMSAHIYASWLPAKSHTLMNSQYGANQHSQSSMCFHLFTNPQVLWDRVFPVARSFFGIRFATIIWKTTHATCDITHTWHDAARVVLIRTGLGAGWAWWPQCGVSGGLSLLNHLCKCSQQTEMKFKEIKYAVSARYEILISKDFRSCSCHSWEWQQTHKEFKSRH